MADKKTAVTRPSVWLWNGIGLRLCGWRDYDPGTDSAVRCRCFCLFYMPLMALDAYRVTENGDQWICLQRVPLTGAAMLGNLLVAVGLIALAMAAWFHDPRGTPPVAAAPADGSRPAPILMSAQDKTEDKAQSQAEAETRKLESEASELLLTTLTEVLGKEFDLDLLAHQGLHPFKLLGMAYDDETTQKHFMERLQSQLSYPGMAARYERLLREPSRRAGAGSVLAVLHSLARNQPALDRLAALISERGTGPIPPELLASFRGERDAEDLQRLRLALEQSTLQLNQARQCEKKKTVAVVLRDMARLHMRLHECGEAVNPDETVVWAEGATQLAPSAATREVLLEAVLLRLHLRLIGSDPAYAAFTAPLRRSLPPRLLLPLALARQPALASKVGQEADCQRVVAMLKDHARRFPHSLSLSGWALLRNVEPDTAVAWARELQKDALGKTERLVWQALTPWSTASIMDAYWALLLDDKVAEAAALLKRYADQGMPLPK